MREIILAKEEDRSKVNIVKALFIMLVLNRNFVQLPIYGMILASAMRKNRKAMLLLVALHYYQRYYANRLQGYQQLIENCNLLNWFGSVKMILEEEPKMERSLFGYHPHSVIPILEITSYFFKQIPEGIRKSTLLVSQKIIDFPFMGMFQKWNGVQSSEKKNMHKLFKLGNNVLLCPGGSQEAVITSEKEYRLVLSKRKGFIKMALIYGYTLYPTFVFNENKAYYNPQVLFKERLELLEILGTGIYPISKYIFFPNKDLNLTWVVGKGIQLEKIENPTLQQIDHYHTLYITELTNLFNRYVDKYDPGAKLVIFDDANPRLRPYL